MKDILQHINSVDGVIGSALFSHKGDVLAHALPALIDVASIKKASSLNMECIHALQVAQSLELLDLRFADGRILIKSFPSAMLFLLCANSINLQVLSITLNLASKRLDAKLKSEAAVAAEQSAIEESKANDGQLRMNISHLANKQASASFDSLGMVAVSQSTSQYITDYFKTPFKKLVLTNTSEGTSGTFPVMVMKDMDSQYDGTVVVGPGIEKKLKVSAGDRIEVGLA
jgi:hypothetical protein